MICQLSKLLDDILLKIPAPLKHIGRFLGVRAFTNSKNQTNLSNLIYPLQQPKGSLPFHGSTSSVGIKDVMNEIIGRNYAI